MLWICLGISQSRMAGTFGELSVMEKKKPIKDNQIKELVVGMPGSVPGIHSGTSQAHPGRLGRFMWKFEFKGQNVRGTDRAYDGTDGTCPRDRRDTQQGMSRQNSLCLLVFSFPNQCSSFPRKQNTKNLQYRSKINDRHYQDTTRNPTIMSQAHSGSSSILKGRWLLERLVHHNNVTGIKTQKTSGNSRARKP